MVEHHGDAAVARHALVPERGHRAITGEDVDVFALHLEAAILRDEAAVVRERAAGVARQAFELGHVDRGAERDHVGVNRHREEWGDGLARGSAAPWKPLTIELVEADLLAGARADIGATAVALAEAHRGAATECAAALHANRFEEGFRCGRER